MPEGDSVARVAARLRPVLEGSIIEAVDGTPTVRRWAPKLLGMKVERIRTTGKHLIIDVQGDTSIGVWLGMTGSWRIDGRRQQPPAGGIRLELVTATHVARCVAAPTVEVERTRVIDTHLERLGPDLLDDTFDWDGFRDRTRLVPPEVILADFLLDQRVMAGVGNVYKSEVLFLEGLHPETPVGSVSSDQVDRLARRARRLLTVNAGRPGRRTTGPGGGGHTWVYEREGRPCRRCRAAVASAIIGNRHGRITYWCPQCQPSPGARAGPGTR